METKQHATEKPTGQWRIQRGNPKISGDKRKQKHNDPKSMEHSKRSSKRVVYNDIGLPQETRKISNDKPFI